MTCHVIICGFDAGAADAASLNNIRLNAVRHDHDKIEMKYYFYFFYILPSDRVATVAVG